MTEQKFKSLEDKKCWQKSKAFSVSVYKIFGENKDYGFRDQIQRASVSIMNNIAEGSERNTDKEFRQFLLIAKGSAGEVRSMLYLALELGYISQAQFNALIEQITEISKMLSGLIKALDF